MAIKKRKIIMMLIIISGLLIMISPRLIPGEESLGIESQPFDDATPNRLSTSSYEYICKVFTFTKTQDSYTFQFHLLKAYMHSIIVQVVTPHSCYLNVTLWDSDYRKFVIFSADISQQDGEFSTPFGTAAEGNHTFLFKAIVQQNLNIKIKILREDIKCLYDKIPQNEHGRIIFYEVSWFSNGYFIPHKITLRTDRSYKFYIGRVSSICIKQNSNGGVIYNMSDPNNIPFAIYENDTLASVAGVNMFSFGTAMAGEYTIKIWIYCEVTWMNVAYAVVDNGPICNPPPDDTNHTLASSNFSIPFDLGLYTVIGAGAIAGAIVIAVVHFRNKNDLGLKIKEK